MPLLIQVYFQTLLTAEKCVSRAYYDVSCVATSNQNCWRQIVKSNENTHIHIHKTISHARSTNRLTDWLRFTLCQIRIPFIKITKCTTNGPGARAWVPSTCIEISNVSLCFCATITIKYHDLPFHFISYWWLHRITRQQSLNLLISIGFFVMGSAAKTSTTHLMSPANKIDPMHVIKRRK